MGSVILVGAGPGDPGLLTQKGRQAIENAQVVVYDRLVSPAILSLIPRDAEKINVGKESSNHLVPQEEINRILLRKAQEDKRVVRLKGGDPFLFGRGGEELELLEAAGRRRGFLVSGGEVDLERSCRMILEEFRNGKIGRFTLETAEDVK